MAAGPPPCKQDRFPDLRRLAEQAVEGKPQTGPPLNSREADRLLHELQVYEIELEIQNEELRKSQNSLLESQARYQDLYDHAPVGYLTLDRVGSIRQANLKIAAMLGVDRDTLIGTPLSRFVFREDQDLLYQHRKRILETDGPQVSEIRLLGPDGRLFHVRLESIAHPDATPHEGQWRMAISDISERVRIEETLRFSEQQFRSISESASEAIVASDENGLIRVWNKGAESIFGYTRDEILGNPMTILIPNDLHDAHEQGMRRVRKTGQSSLAGQVVERRGRRRNGEEFPLDLSLSKWSVNGATFFSAIIRDLSERKKLENALIQARTDAETANRAKSLFLANISHEIRTPMNAILGMGEELAETDLDAEQRHFVNVLNRSGMGLMTLINDLLDLSKVEAGQMFLEHVPFDLHSLVRETMELVETQAKWKKIHLSCTISGDVPVLVQGDPQRLRQILLNLLSNGIKFTEEGSVKMEIGKQDDKLLFAVSDTGIGIAPDLQSAIFKPFVQGETFTVRRFSGTGLGLAITKQLIDLMHGKISVESCPRQGSTFSFTLRLPEAKQPVSVEPAPEASGAERIGQAGDHHELHGLSILVIDDSDDNRLLIQTFLRKIPCALEQAKDGSEGFEKFKRGRFDIVLMDIQMPVMDGFATTRKIREWEQENRSKPARIIALTAHAMGDESRRILDAGCDVFQNKPIRKARLLSILAQSFGRSTRNDLEESP